MESEVRPGRSFEEVLKSVTITTPQQEASQEIDSIFPEGLRSRVLEFVQFEITPRMDDLGKCRDSHLQCSTNFASSQPGL